MYCSNCGAEINDNAVVCEMWMCSQTDSTDRTL